MRFRVRSLLCTLAAAAAIILPGSVNAAAQIDPILRASLTYLRGTPGEAALSLLPRTREIRFGHPFDASPYEPLTEATDLPGSIDPGIYVVIHEAFRTEDPRLLAPLVAFGLWQSQFHRHPNVRIGDNSICGFATDRVQTTIVELYRRYPDLKLRHTYLADQYPALIAGHRGLCYPFE